MGLDGILPKLIDVAFGLSSLPYGPLLRAGCLSVLMTFRRVNDLAEWPGKS